MSETKPSHLPLFDVIIPSISSSVLSSIISNGLTTPINRMHIYRLHYPDKFKTVSGFKELELHKPSMLWRTNLINTILIIPKQSILFTIREVLSKSFPQFSHETQFPKYALNQFMIGGLASVSSIIITHPFSEYWNQFILKRHPIGEPKIKPKFKPFQNFGIVMIHSGLIHTLYFGMFHSLKVKSPYYNNEKNIVQRSIGNLLIAFPIVWIANVVNSPLSSFSSRCLIWTYKLPGEPVNLAEEWKMFVLKRYHFKKSPVTCIFPSLQLVLFDLFMEKFK